MMPDKRVYSFWEINRELVGKAMNIEWDANTSRLFQEIRSKKFSKGLKAIPEFLGVVAKHTLESNFGSTNKRDGYIIVLQRADKCKIGYSKNPSRRIKEIDD